MPIETYKQYQKILDYMSSKRLFEIVKTNDNFYNGRQWEGLKSDTLPKPVFNVLQRNIKYFVATLTSNDISISINPLSSLQDDYERIKPISSEIKRVVETNKIREDSKLMVKDAGVRGSSYLLLEFDPSIETNQLVKGAIKSQIIDNTNVFFGNPYSNKIQTQPYIIIALRQYIGQVKQEAKELGLNQDEIDSIHAEDIESDDGEDLVTVLLKFERVTKIVEETYEKLNTETGVMETLVRDKIVRTIHFSKSIHNMHLIKPTDLGYSRYPISCFGWDPIKNSYLYESPMTAVIPNQIFINKCFALSQMYAMNNAYPKIIYDKSKADIEDLLDTTTATAVVGIDMMGKFMDFIKTPDFSSQILQLIDQTITQTKECMGINDASLGNVRPDNTSAIIALQEGTNVPLEIQRQAYYEMWEDTVRNIIDIMANSYGKRIVYTEDGKADVDFSLLKNLNYDLNIDIGTGAQFSEIAQINTLDKLFQAQAISPKLYVSSVPTKYMPNKNGILKELNEVESQNELLTYEPE